MQISQGLRVAIAAGFLAAPLNACNDPLASPPKHLSLVRTDVVQVRHGQNFVTATGSVQARFQADLSFRVSGRVIERMADVGDHVETGKVLARLDPTEQQADVDAAVAAVAASEAQLRVARTNFDRQKALISQGFTTVTAFDQAQEALRSAEASLEMAQAQFGTAKDALGYTELRADATGVITARNLEIGQVVQPAQPVLALAPDGDRDAVFDVSESIFSGDLDSDQISLRLLSNANVTATGHVREVSPALDPKTSTVRVKVAIKNPPAEMALGSAVAGTAKSKPLAQIAVPWTALTAKGSQPAVWLVDPSTHTVSLQPVTILVYQAGSAVVSAGLVSGDRVVVDGGKLLSVGQAVAYEGDRS